MYTENIKRKSNFCLPGHAMYGFITAACAISALLHDVLLHGAMYVIHLCNGFIT